VWDSRSKVCGVNRSTGSSALCCWFIPSPYCGCLFILLPNRNKGWHEQCTNLFAIPISNLDVVRPINLFWTWQLSYFLDVLLNCSSLNVASYSLPYWCGWTHKLFELSWAGTIIISQIDMYFSSVKYKSTSLCDTWFIIRGKIDDSTLLHSIKGD